MKLEYVVYGAGGHAKVIIDLIEDLNGVVKCVFDDQQHLPQSEFMGIPLKNYDPDLYPEAEMIIAIGNNKFRQKLTDTIKHKFACLIHPRAFVSKHAKVEEGTVILANAIVHTEAVIGKHAIINAGACVDHEAIIKDFVHVGPGSYVGGAATVMNSVIIGALTVVMRNTTIKKDTTTDPLSTIC